MTSASPAKRVRYYADASANQDWGEVVRMCADNLESWRTQRDEYIRRMREEGATLRQIAAAANLTAAGVKKILDRKEVRP